MKCQQCGSELLPGQKKYCRDYLVNNYKHIHRGDKMSMSFSFIKLALVPTRRINLIV
jgi:hypothetical protein